MRLSEYLEREKLSSREFADLIGVTPEAVRLWERGDRCPRPKQIDKIAKATNGAVRANDFFASPLPTAAVAAHAGDKPSIAPEDLEPDQDNDGGCE